MLIIFCVIGILILSLGVFIYKKFGENAEWCYSVIALGVAILIMSLGAMIAVGCCYSPCMTIDKKIEIYRNENTQIENQISIIVDNYMEHESKTFEKVKGKDSVALVSLFPELKSNELVAKQIEIYVANNKTIKELECEKLQYKVYAWWLYFGS